MLKNEAGQPAGRLACAFVVCMQQSGFLGSGRIIVVFPSHMGFSFGVVRAPVRPSVDIDYEILSTDILRQWVVVSNKRKYVHEVLVACPGKSRVR